MYSPAKRISKHVELILLDNLTSESISKWSENRIDNSLLSAFTITQSGLLSLSTMLVTIERSTKWEHNR